jgi:energy-coupling factor transporter ATP-binding protein EcfA2
VSGQGPTVDAGPAPAVELRGIVKRFPGVVANDGVDFALAAGEVHALLGENGAGKSTLMNILDGLYQPDAGEILIDGRPMAFRSPRDAIAAGLGMGLAYSAHAQLALRGVEERHVGAATASLQLCDNLGVALGTGIVGAILTFGVDGGRSAGAAIAVALLAPAFVAVVGLSLSARLPKTTTASIDTPADARR